MSDYRITREQRAYLDSLVCQRISASRDNREYIQKFVNAQNPGLSYALKAGWGTDEKDKVAYYIVREPQEGGEPLFFFSLRCGEVDVPYNLEKLRVAMENSEALLDAAYGLDAPDWAKAIVEKRKVNGVLPPSKLKEFYNRHRRNMQKWRLYDNEVRLEGTNIIRTKQALAGVELVHFCAHTPAAQRWKEMGFQPQTLGRTMFWNFVVPVIQQVRDLVGCEYLYLFAADEKKHGKLVRYYQELGFEIREDLCVSKPEYDFGCFFMCQKVTALRNRRNAFFRNYNAPKEAN